MHARAVMRPRPVSSLVIAVTKMDVPPHAQTTVTMHAVSKATLHGCNSWVRMMSARSQLGGLERMQPPEEQPMAGHPASLGCCHTPPSLPLVLPTHITRARCQTRSSGGAAPHPPHTPLLQGGAAAGGPPCDHF